MLLILATRFQSLMLKTSKLWKSENVFLQRWFIKKYIYIRKFELENQLFTNLIFNYFALHAIFSHKKAIKIIINISFLLQNPPFRLFIFGTRKLWNYSVQVFLVGFSSFLPSTDEEIRLTSLGKILKSKNFLTYCVSSKVKTSNSERSVCHLTLIIFTC